LRLRKLDVSGPKWENGPEIKRIPRHDLNLIINNWFKHVQTSCSNLSAQRWTCLTRPDNMFRPQSHATVPKCYYGIVLLRSWSTKDPKFHVQKLDTDWTQKNRTNKSNHEGFTGDLPVGDLPTLLTLQRKIRRKKAFKRPGMSHLSLSGKSRLPLSSCTFGSKSCPDLL